MLNSNNVTVISFLFVYYFYTLTHYNNNIRKIQVFGHQWAERNICICMNNNKVQTWLIIVYKKKIFSSLIVISFFFFILLYTFLLLLLLLCQTILTLSISLLERLGFQRYFNINYTTMSQKCYLTQAYCDIMIFLLDYLNPQFINI